MSTRRRGSTDIEMAKNFLPLGDADSARAPSAPVTVRLATAAAAACLGALQFGFACGGLNVPQAAICSDLGISATGVAWSSMMSVWCLGGLAGAQSASGVADARGRRALLALVGAVCMLSGALQFCAGRLALAGRGGALALLLAARFISGVGCGAATVGVPLYLGETAPVALRGAFGSLNQLAICGGIFGAQVLGAALQAHTTVHWSYLLGVPALLGAVQLVALPALPESPRWCVAHGRPTDAEASLEALRPAGADVAGEIRELHAEVGPAGIAPVAGVGGGGGLASLAQDKSLRLPLLVAASMMVGQQWSGINAVFFYSTGFFAAAGLSNPVLGTLLASGVNLGAILLATPLMEVSGRRRLLLAGIGGMLGSGVVLTFVLVAKASGALSGPLVDAAAVGSVLVFVGFFELGPGPIPWLIGSEVFPEEPRAAAMSACAALNWLCNAAVGLGFPPMQRAFGSLAFVPFCAVLAAWLRLASVYVPETKGRSVAQVQEEFARMAGAASSKGV